MKERIINILNSFKDKNILVIGDVMLDRYIWGDAKRISPEAPVQIVNVKKEQHIPGGAGNTATNIASLGGGVSIIGMVGDDPASKILISELKKRNIETDGIIVDKERPTIQKVRVMGQKQQLLRIDYEKTQGVNEKIKNEIIDSVKNRIKQADIVVFTDYDKGVFTENSAKDLIKLAKENNKKIIVDPKPGNATYYKGVDLITPNHKEACEILGVKESNDEGLVKIGNKIVEKLDSNLLITRGEHGMSLFEKKENAVKVTDISTKAKEVYDVSGAGDTVVAATALALASGAELNEAAIVANCAAGVVVGKLGVATVSAQELKEEFKKKEDKIRSREEIEQIAEDLRKEGKKIVTANGGFDLMHMGHIKFLKEAKEQGDVLIIGLNSDVSIKKSKSKDRPLISQDSRVGMLSSLELVDYIVVMDEKDVAVPLVKLVKPDVHVNGADWGEDCIEAGAVKGVGARLHIVQLVDKLSTTSLINKIKNA